MKKGMVCLFIAAGIAVAAATAWPQAAGRTAPGYGPWPCTATVEGAPTATQGYGITSDGKGVYANGADGVSCLMYLPAPYSAAASQGQFMLYGMSGNVRKGRNLFYPGQAASLDTPPYPGFAANYGGRFDVFGASNLTVGSTVGLTAFSRAGNTALFQADGITEGAPVSTATVTRTAACTWTITVSLDDAHPNMSLWTGSNLSVYAGTFRMPFRITVNVTDGVLGGGANGTSPYTCSTWKLQ